MSKSPERYQPSEEEIQKAEENLSETERQASEARERLYEARQELGIKTDDLQYSSRAFSSQRDSAQTETIHGTINNGPFLFLSKSSVYEDPNLTNLKEDPIYQGRSDFLELTSSEKEARNPHHNWYGDLDLDEETSSNLFERFKGLAKAHSDEIELTKKAVKEHVEKQNELAKKAVNELKGKMKETPHKEAGVGSDENNEREEDVLKYIHSTLLREK